MKPSDIRKIELVRGPCFGSCPVFDFTVSRDNGYRYDGQLHVEPLGIRTGGFPYSFFDRLAETCIDLRIHELDDFYPTDFEDGNITVVRIHHAEEIKTVNNQAGYGPTRLWAFALVIEALMISLFSYKNVNRRPTGKC
ncbi:MAG: DUF6438 domain-containing protein [Fimbriiglobus sp.]